MVNTFTDSLNEKDKSLITYPTGNKQFRFGDGEQQMSIKGADIPITIGRTKLMLHTDIVSAQIPLLLSRSSMKKGDMMLNFNNDSLIFKGETIPLHTTTTGLFFENKIILHLIDVCTRHSSASFIPNKKKETIINAIFKTWIAIYGNPRKFLIDNGGEWANEEFLEMCDSLGIDIKTTAAESPWSNGVVERHSQVLANMMYKIIDDTNCSHELALFWAVNAKNSLCIWSKS